MPSIQPIADIVRRAGDRAARAQQDYAFADRRYKHDGSVVTDVDFAVEDELCAGISEHMPDAALVTEERARDARADAPYTFVIDPVDGTDNFSNGMPLWNVAVGVLDAASTPCAGIVYAPALGLMLQADFDRGLSCNGEPLPRAPAVETVDGLSSLMISSRVPQRFDLTAYPGKVRALGSAALHVVMPAVYPSVVGVLQEENIFAWDVAAAHAILRAAGCELAYLDGAELDYAAMRTDGWRLQGLLLGGKPGAVPILRRQCRPVVGS